MKKFLIVLLLALVSNMPVALSNTFDTDSLARQEGAKKADLRYFDSKKISSYKGDKDFQYQVGPRIKSNFLYNLINRFIKWLTGKDIEGLSMDGGLILTLIKWALYLFVGTAIVFVILQLLKMKTSGLVNQQSRNALEHDVFAEDIHSMNFEKSIQEAIDGKQYRLVIRLYYLFALKRLSDKGKISWRPSKTNFDYQAELKDDLLKSHFHILGYYFEFIWYGNFEVGEAIIEEVKSSFLSMEKAIL